MSEPTPSMATPRVAAGAGRVLLVRPTYKPWESKNSSHTGTSPGGYVEPGESPTSACAREVREELGIEPMLGSLLVVDWAPNAGEGDKMLFIFDGGELAPDQEASIRLQSAELSEYAFTDPERFDEVLIPRLSRRLRLAIDAHRHGRPIYAEHGASASHATA